MKRLLLILTVLLSVIRTMGQVTITSDPVVYAPDEEVTWYFDMSEKMQVEGEPFYIWTWAPSNPEDVLGTPDAWNNPSDACTLKYVGNCIYKLTMTPTEFYGVTAEQLYANGDIFWMNIRNDAKEDVTGSLQAPHPFNSEFQNFLDTEKDLQVYPSTFTMKDHISILVNLNKLNISGQGVGALAGKNFGNLHMHSGPNDFADHIVEANMGVPELVQKTMLKKVNFGDGSIYKMDMTPMEYYGITDEEVMNGYQMRDIMFLLPTTDWAAMGVAASGDNFVLQCGEVEPEPDPVFSTFPTRLSQLDFLTIMRQYDDGMTNLNYEIAGGNTTLRGEFGGTRQLRTVTVNLLDGFKSEQNIDRLHIVVTRNGNVVEDRTIPLVPVSEIE